MAVDWQQVFDVFMRVVMVGILIWIGYTLKKWYSDESTRPSWLISIINIGYPEKYKKLSGMYPYDSNLSIVVDTKSTSANTCMANCSVTYACNGTIWANATCSHVTSDFGKSIMVPRSGSDVYVKMSRTSPKWGFVSYPGKDLGFSSNVASQHYGTISTETNPEKLSNICIQQFLTSNCEGFSTDTNLNQTWFVTNASNIESVSNVNSYVLQLLGDGNFTNL